MLSNEPFFFSDSEDHACLLLHGLGGGPYEMRLLGQSLYQAGYATQAFNYPGHEPDLIKMPPSNWQQWYAAVEENYQKLTQRYQSVSLVGFSTGCPLALELASNYAVKNLVMLSPFLALKKPWYLPFKPELFLPMVKNVIKEVPRIPPSARIEQPLGLATFNLESVMSALDLIEIVKGKLDKITVPTLIIQSPLDRVVDPSGANLLYENLGSRDRRLIWLENSDHTITLDVEREKVFQEVKDFLAEYS
jgi:carboxylesterase